MRTTLLIVGFLSAVPLFPGTIITGAVGDQTCPGTDTCNITVHGSLIDDVSGIISSVGVGGASGHVQTYTGTWWTDYPYPYLLPSIYLPYAHVSVTLDYPSDWGNIELDGFVQAHSDDYNVNGPDYLSDPTVHVNGQLIQHFSTGTDTGYDRQYGTPYVFTHNPGDPFELSFEYTVATPVRGDNNWLDWSIGGYNLGSSVPVSDTPEPTTTGLLSLAGAAGALFMRRKFSRQ